MIAGLLKNPRHERVLQILDLERKVILNGPLSGLKPLVDRREALVDELLAQETPPPESFLTALKLKAERNSRLLLASLAGMKAATAQIDRIRDARDHLRTYTAAGASVEVRRPQITRGQRA